MLAIALANKLARIAWAVLARGGTYQPRSPMQHDKGSLRFTEEMPATPLRHHHSPHWASERRWLRGDGFT
jgi:hypothetical protein